jgi:hypothetical protein
LDAEQTGNRLIARHPRETGSFLIFQIVGTASDATQALGAPASGYRRYRLRRSRRALRFLLPILRRRRGLDIRQLLSNYPEIVCFILIRAG